MAVREVGSDFRGVSQKGEFEIIEVPPPLFSCVQIESRVLYMLGKCSTVDYTLSPETLTLFRLSLCLSLCVSVSDSLSAFLYVVWE